MVHDRDRSLKALTARYAADFVHLGFEADAPGGPLYPDLPDRRLPALEREVDFVVRVDWHGQPVLLLLEFETCWKPNVPQRIAEYALRLHLRYELPVQATVVVLRPGGRLRAHGRWASVRSRRCAAGSAWFGCGRLRRGP